MSRYKFDCIFYYVSDLDKSIFFYQNILGFQLKSRDVVARFDINGVLFELVPTDDKSQVSGQGNARLCLEVKKNIEEEVNHLKKQGIQIKDIKVVSNGKLATFLDPDGNEVVLWQYL